MKTICWLFTLSLISLKLFGMQYAEPGMAPWGPDSELLEVKKEKRGAPLTGQSRSSPAQKGCHALIRFFQVHISPIDGPRSSFYPTSSQYALEAIQKYGVFKGIAMGCDRLMRENGEMWVYDTTKDYGIERKLDPVR
jgi:putative component of membrane protein insertase Oxa1/YidC/SpoIIIJ protein YidD